MNIVAIMQARMGSTRLPGKILQDIAGKPMLQRSVERSLLSKRITSFIVATTSLDRDDVIADYCSRQGWNCHRGSELDVLDRYYRAAQEAGADVVVRLTSDCPLLDAGVIDRIIDAYLATSGTDYACSFLPSRTYPRGMDVEVFSFAALERAWKEDENPAYREHVTMYILRNPEIFSLIGVPNSTNWSDLRWTVDEQADLDFVDAVYRAMPNDSFRWFELIDLLQRKPELKTINAHIQQFTLK